MWVRRVGESVRALAYAPDSRTLYTVEGARVRAWDLASRQSTPLFRLRDLGVGSVSDLWNVGGRYLLFNATDLLAWDLRKGKPVAVPSFIRRACRPVGGESTAVRFITTSYELIRSWDLTTNKLKTVIRKPADFTGLFRFAFSPDGRTAALLDDRRRGALVTVETGASVPIGFPQDAWVGGVQFRADGALVWIEWNGVRVSSAANPNKFSAPLACKWPHSAFALHPSAPLFAALNGAERVTLFSLSTGEALRSFDLDFGQTLRHICFAPDGLTCAVCGSNKQFAVFDVDL
jgi:WD40 repeat protein